MALRYEKLGCLKRGHVNGVSAVALSCRGTYVVTAGVVDCTVYIWRVADLKLLYTHKSSSAVLCLHWLPGREDAFVCGSHGGVLLSVSFTPKTFNVTGFWAQKYPIEHLAVKGSSLASGAHSDVAIWAWQKRQWRHAVDLVRPPTNSLNERSEVLVTSIHWMPRSSFLLVTYMHHGVGIFDSTNWTLVRHIPISSPIANASVSPDGTTIAISNMVSGFELYDLTSQESFQAFPHPVGALRAVPVMFVHGGHALLGGSTVGVAHLWNIHNARVHQRFSLGAANNIMAIAANYDDATDRFLIATGIANAGAPASVVLWVARDPQSRRNVVKRCTMSCIGISSLIVISVSIVCAWYYGVPHVAREI